MKDFKKLMIWQLGMDIVDSIYEIIPSLPSDERFGIRSQMTRCAVSIPGNIAEELIAINQKAKGKRQISKGNSEGTHF